MSTIPQESVVHSDPRVLPREQCVLRYVLDRRAAEQPDEVFAVFEDGTEWTLAEMRQRTLAVAAGLGELGVRQGDHVAMWLPNGKEALVTFFAISYLGALYVPFNTAYRGRILEHVVENSDAEVIVAHADLLPRLEEISCARLRTAVIVGSGEAPRGLKPVAYSTLSSCEAELPALERAIEPWDTHAIIYTSGTTGPSKGVLCSYLHIYSNPSWPFIKDGDRFLANMPMFHMGGMLTVTMLYRNGSVAMMENFSTKTFWPFVRKTRCTAIFLLGAMATFLLKEEPSAEEREHDVRLAVLVPLTSNHREVAERFGVDIFTIFNMTEVSTPMVSEANPTKAGSCGKVREGVEVRLVDANDCEVPVGATGELIVRTDRPWAMNHGYYKNPEATAEAWRNGWFHTGDGFRQDEEGNFYFVDRVKDAIRRRGENISSFEVEAEVIAHPSVRDVAAIGVTSEHSENDVLIAVTPVEGKTIDPVELIMFLKDRMPHFMVPRYIRIMDDLPKTPTSKVRKHVLREQAVTEDTWDREAAGISIRRDQLRST